MIIDKKILSVSLLFTVVISFYGNFSFRALFVWLPSFIFILLSFFFVIINAKVSKDVLNNIFINSFWLIFSLFMSFSVLSPEIHLKAILETLLYYLFFVSLLSALPKRKDSIFKMLLLSANIFTVASVFIFVYQSVFVPNFSFTAFSGFHSNRNTFALVCLIFLTIYTNCPRDIRGRNIDSIRFIIVFSLSVLILVTGSTKGVLGLVVIIMVNLIIKYGIKRGVPYLLLISALLVVGLSVFNDSMARIENKVDAIVTFDNNYDENNIGNDSGKVRVFLAYNAYDIFLDNFYTGVGVNNGQYYLTVPVSFRNSMDSINSQNNITEMLLNGGVVGFLLYYAPILFLLIKLILLKRKSFVEIIIITLLIIKLSLDTGMKSYNDASHEFILVLSWFLYFKFTSEKLK